AARGGPAAEHLPLAVDLLRRRGVGAPDALALRGRAGALATLARDRSDRTWGAAWGAALVRHALDLRDGARVADPQRAYRLRDREVPRRADHDAHGFPRVRSRPPGRRQDAGVVRRG